MQPEAAHGGDAGHLVAVDDGVAGVGEVVEIHEQLHPAEDVVAELEVQQGVGLVGYGLVYIETGDSLHLLQVSWNRSLSPCSCMAETAGS